MTEPLPAGSTIGILGGGQLGRMLSVAAARLGLKTHIFEPGTNPPAGDVAAQVTTAPYNNIDALAEFAQSVSVITYEFENIPTSALDVLEKYAPVHPNRNALRISQDRKTEKEFMQSLGLKTAPFATVDGLWSVAAWPLATADSSSMRWKRDLSEPHCRHAQSSGTFSQLPPSSSSS